MPQQAAAEDTRDQCVPLPGADSSAATITSSTWSSRLQAQDTSELPFLGDAYDSHPAKDRSLPDRLPVPWPSMCTAPSDPSSSASLSLVSLV